MYNRHNYSLFSSFLFENSTDKLYLQDGIPNHVLVDDKTKQQRVVVLVVLLLLSLPVDMLSLLPLFHHYML